jgi:hypothetical protein
MFRWFVAAFLVLLPTVVSAQQNVDEAREAFALGNLAYGEGEYESAVRHFRDANRLAPNARLLDYIGRCYFNLGRLEDAYEAYSSFAETSAEAAAEAEPVLHDIRSAMQENALNEASADLSSAVAMAMGEQPQPRNVMRTQFDSHIRDVTVQVRTNPRGAEVYVDSVELGSIGSTPLETVMFAGPAYIEVRMPNYHPEGRLVSITPVGRDESIPVIEFTLRPIQVEARISVQPMTASAVYIPRGGAARPLGIGGWEGELPAGPASFLLQQGGRDRTIEVDLQPNEDRSPVEVHLSLDDRPVTSTQFQIGTLIIVSEAEGGSIEVDGRTVGSTPGELRVDLTPGPHSVRLVADRACPWSQSVEVTANNETRVYTPPQLQRGRCR